MIKREMVVIDSILHITSTTHNIYGEVDIYTYTVTKSTVLNDLKEAILNFVEAQNHVNTAHTTWTKSIMFDEYDEPYNEHRLDSAIFEMEYYEEDIMEHISRLKCFILDNDDIALLKQAEAIISNM